MAGKWYSEKDFEEDFWSMADIPPSSRPCPISDNMRRARKIQQQVNSIYLDPGFTAPGNDKEDEEEIVHCLPSRGRLFQTNLRRPGGKLSTNDFRKEVQSQIRQVAGPGYSNELIEHAFKTREEDEETVKRKCYFQRAPSRGSNGAEVLERQGTSKSKEQIVLTDDKQFPSLRRSGGKA